MEAQDIKTLIQEMSSMKLQQENYFRKFSPAHSIGKLFSIKWVYRVRWYQVRLVEYSITLS